MQDITRHRIASIDLLKGLVMVLMALDHARDYFHAPAFFYDPTYPAMTTIPIFFTRWFTHFCAPTFSFLAGISAFMMGRKKTTVQLTSFLLKRGLWLIFIELTIVSFGWFFDPLFRSPSLIVIWSLGVSMIALAALIHLPKSYILVFSCVLIFGHNAFDTIHYDNIIWAMLHDGAYYEYQNGYHLLIGYPLVPWIAVMSLGYYFGTFYNPDVPAARRRKVFNLIGFSAIVLFIVLRSTNLYGNFEWKHYDDATKNFMAFLNLNKYSPSLQYLLVTSGAAFLFLANFEKVKGKLVDFFSTFGRVPFFYYIVHLYVIHLVAMLFAELSGKGWKAMILRDWVTALPEMRGYGFRLWVVYAVWISIILLIYPVCKKFDAYKMKHKEKWWLSYL